MLRLFMLSCLCFISLICFSQGENQIKLRYWNGTTDGNGVANTVGLQVSAVRVPVANALQRVDEATLSDEPKFYLKKKFVLFFTIQNVSTQDVAIYDWAFKAVCPVDNMGRKFDANSMVPLVTPYIPASIYIVLKPGEKKQFYSAETDFFWCLPQDKEDLVNNPKYFQALITCGSIADSASSVNPSQKLGIFQPMNTMPPKPENDIDPQLERMIKEHNDLIQKNENDKAESLKSRILKITNAAYPLQVKLVESKLSKPQPVTIVAPPTERGVLSSNGKKPILATYKDDNGKWIAMGPYMTTDPYDTENQALGSLFYSDSDLTFLCQRGKFKIYNLNGKVEHDARDIRSALKLLGINDIPE